MPKEENIGITVKKDEDIAEWYGQVCLRADLADYAPVKGCMIIKPNGYAIISTENLASWHNIFALLLGQQAFSQTISKKSHVGCKLSLHSHEKTGTWANNRGPIHNKIFTYEGLRQIFNLYQFKVESLIGSGYYPIPTRSLMKIAGRLDPRHTHFITIKIRK